MNKRSWILIAIVVGSLLIGFVGGMYAGERLSLDVVQKLVRHKHAADVGIRVGVLTRIRDGRIQNAIAILETELDSDLVGLSPYADEPANHRDPQVLDVVAHAKSYRKKFPHPSSTPEGDAAVRKLFSLIPASSNAPVK